MKKTIFTIILALAGLILISVATLSSPDTENKQEVKPEAKPEVKSEVKTIQCKGSAKCFFGKVTAIIDGDTIKVDGKPIRLALTSTPEKDEIGGKEATSFTLSFCPPGITALVDEDDGQYEGSYGRMIAAVYCNDMLLNAALLDSGHATISEMFCNSSEFGNEDWALRNGCASKSQEFVPPEIIPESTQPQISNCDPSYPDVCIPTFPPDLDCGEIHYRNFKVLQPDPHRFDGDKDGLGCEGS